MNNDNNNNSKVNISLYKKCNYCFSLINKNKINIHIKKCKNKLNIKI